MTMTLTQKYMMEAGGNRPRAILQFTRDLMAPDPATLRAGYTLPNAILATEEYWHLSPHEVEELKQAIDGK